MNKPSARSRRAAERRGRRAEWLAAWALRLKGYRILAQRVRRPGGEIDLIARRGNVLAFVEVKQRATLADALEAVPNRSWQRIAIAAESWAAHQPTLQDCNWRYDIIALAPLRWPVHKTDYWRP